MFHWLKRFVRSRTGPIPQDKAEVWQKRLSFFYMFVGWNALAYAGYTYYYRESLGIQVDLKESTAERMVRLKQVPEATVYRFQNFSYKGSKELKNKDNNPEDTPPSDTELLASE